MLHFAIYVYTLMLVVYYQHMTLVIIDIIGLNALLSDLKAQK